MLKSSAYGHQLTARFFQAMLLVPMVGGGVAACSSSVSTGSTSSSGSAGSDTSSASGGGAGAMSSSSTGTMTNYGGPTVACMMWPMSLATGGTSGAGGAGGAGGKGAGGMSGTGGVAGQSGAGGMGLPPCPTQAEAFKFFVTDQSGCSYGGITSDGTYKPATGECCYAATIGGCTGRPFLVEERPRTAPLRRVATSGWTANLAPQSASLDPAVRADEARHAELAWRTIAWALRTGGAAVRAAVNEVFAELRGPRSGAPSEPVDADLAAHGRLARSRLDAVHDHARLQIIGPSARALLAATVAHA